MKNVLVSFFVGLIFAVGLGISGMTQPQKIVGFLDLFGEWDMALLFVMVGAVGVHAVAFALSRKVPRPILAEEWRRPTQDRITGRLILGSFIFGIGWGLGGYCPGPGLVSLSTFEFRPFLFVGSMVVGMALFRLLDRALKLRSSRASGELE